MLLRLAEDTFAYADNASLVAVAPNWTAVCGRMGVSSGQVHPNWDGASSPAMIGCAYWSGCAFPDDQYSEATAYPSTPPGYYMGLAVRCSGTTYYRALIVTDAGLLIYKVVAGVTTSLSATTLTDIPAGTVCRLEAIGNTISFYVGDVAAVAAVDDDIASGSPGVCSFGLTDPGNQALLDDWSGGEIGTGVEDNQEAPNTRVRARHGGR